MGFIKSCDMCGKTEAVKGTTFKMREDEFALQFDTYDGRRMNVYVGNYIISADKESEDTKIENEIADRLIEFRCGKEREAGPEDAADIRIDVMRKYGRMCDEEDGLLEAHRRLKLNVICDRCRKELVRLTAEYGSVITSDQRHRIKHIDDVGRVTKEQWRKLREATSLPFTGK